MGEQWLVTRTKSKVTEFLCKGNVWDPDKDKAEPMAEEFAKGTVNGLSILETGRKGTNPFRYETVIAPFHHVHHADTSPLFLYCPDHRVSQPLF